MSLNTDLLTTTTNILYISIFIFALIMLFSVFKRKTHKKRSISEVDMYKIQLKRRKRELNSGPISNYLSALDAYFSEKDPNKAESSINLLLIASLFFAGIMFYFTSILIALITFLAFHFLVSIAVKKKDDDEYKKAEYKLPETIDVLIRGFSKSDDLQTIIYETSKNASEPFSTMFSEIARIMTSSGHVKVLKDYTKKSKSVWMHSLFTILTRYKEDAKKEDTIENLTHLREMIKQENQLKRALMSDKRYSVVVNYLFAGISVVGNIALMFFFPHISRPAYFGTPIGILMIAGGYGCVLGIYILTKKMSSSGEIKMGGK